MSLLFISLTNLLWILLGILSVATIVVFYFFIPVGLWITALFSGVKINILQLVGMRLRKVPPALIVNNMIKALKAGLQIKIDQLETHFLAHGDVNKVIDALISADKANIELNFQLASAIDLAGRDVLTAVQDTVNTKVITSPKVEAVAKDGIQLIAIARITVRANIHKLVGGAGEKTIIGRVGQGIVAAIGSSDSHKEVLSNPDLISKRILEAGLDSGTAYKILSIDIPDIDVGENIGARLDADQAEADLKVAQAKAEERRAMAVAAEQEFTARAQEMRAKVIEAEAQIPLAMAEAFRTGNLGLMDYYKMRNIESDTRMRNSLSELDDGPKS